MKHRRLTVAFILALAFPVSDYAGATTDTHCRASGDPAHSMHAQTDDRRHGHGPAHGPAHESAQATDRDDGCQCGCGDAAGCSVSGCTVATLPSAIETDAGHLIQSFRPDTNPPAISPRPRLFFRPPILLA